MATLSTVREHIKSDLVIVGSVYDTTIDNAIRSALRELRGRKYWFLEKNANITLLNGNHSVALPSDFSMHDEFAYTYQNRLYVDDNGFDFITYTELKKEYYMYMRTGKPEACAIYDDTLYVSHNTNADLTISCDYYKQDTILPTADSDTSVWFDEGYDVVVSRAKVLFKTTSTGFELTEKDSASAQVFMEALNRQQEARFML